MTENLVLEQIKKDIDKHLENYLVEGYTSITFDLIENKGPKVTLRTISLEEQLEIEAEMKKFGDTEIVKYIIHWQQLEHLSRCVLTFGNLTFKNHEEAKIFLQSKGLALLDKLLKLQYALENAFKDMFNTDNIENFTTTPSTDTKQS